MDSHNHDAKDHHNISNKKGWYVTISDRYGVSLACELAGWMLAHCGKYRRLQAGAGEDLRLRLCTPFLIRDSKMGLAVAGLGV